MKFPEQYRNKFERHACPPAYKTDQGDEFGVFIIPNGGEVLYCIATAGMIAADDAGAEAFGSIQWNHVSVSIRARRSGVRVSRCPTWSQMCLVKDSFWDPEEEVIQFHPRASEYVNLYPSCLHLWKAVGFEQPRPPKIFVGPASSTHHTAE